MYCASNVTAPGKRSVKNSNSGDMIPTSDAASTRRPARRILPLINVIPMKHSAIAVT
jgi:hypothetical protein